MAASTKVLKLKTVVSHGKQCCSKIFIRNASWTTFFKKPKEENEAIPRKIKPFDGPSTTSRLQSLKKKTYRSKSNSPLHIDDCQSECEGLWLGVSCSVRGYNPPADVEAKILSIAATIIGFQVDMSYQLNDRLIKFKLLTKLMEEFDHIIPNTELCDLNTLANVVSYFDTPVRDTTSFDDLARQKLPKNLHIQLEPLRFDPETDTFFDGKTAFPNRPTIVSSLKYSKKYKGHSGESRNARSLTNFEEQKQLFEDAEKLNYTVKSS